MADCHQHFLRFEAIITPSSHDRHMALAVRRSVRHALAADCERRGLSIRFHPQGSFRLLTSVLRRSLDIDDGVMFRAESFSREPEIEELHEITYSALRRAEFAAFCKAPCVRVLHPNGVRLDVVIYLDTGHMVQYAHRTDGWVQIHPADLISWFEQAAEASPQLRRLVKYYKIWAARHPYDRMPSGVIAMILMTTLYHAHPRDDIAFVETMNRVREHLEAGRGCYRPTPPVGEELLSREANAAQIERFITILLHLIKKGRSAIATSDIESSIAQWKKLLGPKFGPTGLGVSPEMRAVELRSVLEDLWDTTDVAHAQLGGGG